MAVLLEVCVDARAGLEAALAGGADRLELCARLDLGGLSPEPGFLREAVARCRGGRASPAPPTAGRAAEEIPVHAMIRLRPGPFVLGAGDIEPMLAEIERARASGAAGVVLGPLRADGAIDGAALERLAAHARPLSVTFHRAFDETRDRMQALEQLAALGVERVLTSGGAPTAFEGRFELRRMVERAAGRVAVMAGGGVRPWNAAEIVRASGVAELHGSVPFDARAAL